VKIYEEISKASQSNMSSRSMDIDQGIDEHAQKLQLAEHSSPRIKKLMKK
jgi:hypothetical protein